MCYRSSLEKLVTENPSYKGKGGLTQKMHKRLTSAARCAIKMRSQEPDTRKPVKLLEQDLVNGPLHCFGLHSRCSTDFCKVAREREKASSTADALGKVSNAQNDAQSSCESSDDDDRSSNIPHTSTSSDGVGDHDGPSCSDLEGKCTYLQKYKRYTHT